MEEEQCNTSPSLRNKLKQTLCLRDLINRIGRHLQLQRRHCSMADFKYDPLSYALNFDEGDFHGHYVEAAPLRRSSARVSALPPLKTAASAGITCL
ncbi:hypothetical protein RHSIM_Rhsim01G0052500 [Rhododendron simsii]|uniref:Uncharacterized protein n=1 Tax=Rhododendron simsii TaxID=118357 RepID=A0A834LVM7_RHOSS|nr:hypothetical protein RHSIM_Rhsim01G0052500 [Rhododendron simsii]